MKSWLAIVRRVDKTLTAPSGRASMGHAGRTIAFCVANSVKNDQKTDGGDACGDRPAASRGILAFEGNKIVFDEEHGQMAANDSGP